MDERDALQPLRDLGQRLDRVRSERQRSASGISQGGAGVSQSTLGLALRIGVELVVAVIVGAAIGWAFDRWLGTRPWGMIVGFFLGVAAGMLNVWRAVAGMGMAMGYRRQEPASGLRRKDADWSDEDED
ncbi:MAG TPA: AtpZ/AtpI family protein [Stellaceae bacterium]|nr:AtpZ/AtpI family protein [Stellaceae bacterium]